MKYKAGGELLERICNAGRFSEDEDSLTQLTSSSPRHYRVVICSLPIQGRCSPALAISAFVSANAGTVSLPTRCLFAASIDDNILA
ncbi:hypothetical protein OIU77_017612 [Salix suchowensis]|uniref:Uncharacterized protein n=1 Tax=Salix suchowensis TaxID=1278906 RepID=A0ABQ8ZPU2_9ROSI|nr:hypothetical protein OIU77_017612 [Salix suchowensis]